MNVDSLKAGWRSTEFWIATGVALAGIGFAVAGFPWPGLVAAALASSGYGIGRGVTKAAFTQRGGSMSKQV